MKFHWINSFPTNPPYLSKHSVGGRAKKTDRHKVSQLELKANYEFWKQLNDTLSTGCCCGCWLVVEWSEEENTFFLLRIQQVNSLRWRQHDTITIGEKKRVCLWFEILLQQRWCCWQIINRFTITVYTWLCHFGQSMFVRSVHVSIVTLHTLQVVV